MKNSPIHSRTLYSLSGLRDGWLRERSFRTHIVLSAAVLIPFTVLRPPAIWWALVLLALAVGLAFELINGALEALADLLHPGRHPEVRAIKDMASGAAFLVNMAAAGLAVGALASTAAGRGQDQTETARPASNADAQHSAATGRSAFPESISRRRPSIAIGVLESRMSRKSRRSPVKPVHLPPAPGAA